MDNVILFFYIGENKQDRSILLVGGCLLEAAHPCRDDVAGVPGVPGGAGCRGAGPRGQELLGVGAGPREPSVRHGQGVGVLVRVPVPAAMHWWSQSVAICLQKTS